MKVFTRIELLLVHFDKRSNDVKVIAVKVVMVATNAGRT